MSYLQTSSRSINAVVTSAGLMNKTVKVRVGTQKWNKKVRKYFNRHEHHLVHDPHNSLRAGDIIEISPGWRVSKDVRHVVNKIIAPFGVPIDARPPIPTESERIEERLTRKFEKDIRRGKIIEVLEELHEGKGMEGEIELTPDVAEALAAQVEVEHAKHVQPTPEEVKKVEAEEPVKEETPKKKGWFS